MVAPSLRIFPPSEGKKEGTMVDLDTGYARLIVAIIKQAVVDARKEGRQPCHSGYSASMFLMSDDFIEICHLINCDGEMIRNRVLQEI